MFRRGLRCARRLLLAIALTSIARPLTAAEPVTAMDASDFLQTIGVNTHMGSPPSGPTGTSYGNPEAIIGQLRLTGIKHIRDTLYVGARLPALLALNQALGVKVDLVYDDYSSDGGAKALRAALANVRPAVKMIEAFEGPNEPDQFGLHFDGLTSADAVYEAQKTLYAAVKADRAFAGIPIFCPALSFPAAGGLASKLRDLSSLCDFASSHNYIENHSLGPALPLDYLRRWSAFPSAFVPGRPLVTTEGGWPTNPGDAEGVDEATQAKYLLTYLLDAAVLGISRSYIYDLSDDGPDPAFKANVYHYGLFRHDGTPKPAAKMFAAINALLGGPAATGEPAAFRISDLPDNGHSLTFRRPNGNQVIAIWTENYLWDRDRHAPKPPVETRVTVEFASKVSAVRRVDVFSAASSQVLALDGNKVAVVVPAHAIFLEVDGSARPDK